MLLFQNILLPIFLCLTDLRKHFFITNDRFQQSIKSRIKDVCELNTALFKCILRFLACYCLFLLIAFLDILLIAITLSVHLECSTGCGMRRLEFMYHKDRLCNILEHSKQSFIFQIILSVSSVLKASFCWIWLSSNRE